MTHEVHQALSLSTPSGTTALLLDDVVEAALDAELEHTHLTGVHMGDVGSGRAVELVRTGLIPGPGAVDSDRIRAF
jgi:hypothetical protein